MPELAKPGAGLPLLERLVAKYYFVGFRFPRMKWEEAVSAFARETSRIASLVSPLSAEIASTRRLIPRMAGLEDSSRNWSPAMLLEHLMTAASDMTEIAVMLSQSKTPNIEVDIAKIKPTGKFFQGPAMSGAQMTGSFTSKMQELSARLEAEASARPSGLTHPHPWFGPITAQQWAWINASHQRIHRRQLEKILSA